MMSKCNIRNYSIFLKDHTLYASFEYHGTDYAADMARMAADKTTQVWWAIMEPMQSPMPTRKKSEWWAAMEEVFPSRLWVGSASFRFGRLGEGEPVERSGRALFYPTHAQRARMNGARRVLAGKTVEPCGTGA
jgi:L-rhamnose mutarotase